ncbi:MAG: hypothetical protein ACETWG_12065 [Candidatus Neomarinimicrobiota bacterium]
MGLSNTKSIIVLLAIGLLIEVFPLAAQATISEDEFNSLAHRLSAAATFAQLPRGEFGAITATLFPVLYRSENYALCLLPIVGLQWWVSPNLAVYGGLGGGMVERQVVQFQRIGFRYLPTTLALGTFTPELIFTQNRIDGIAAYKLKWNALRLSYATNIDGEYFALGVVLLFPRIFPSLTVRAPDVPAKLELSKRYLSISAGYDLFWWLRFSVRALLNPEVVSGGAQLSLTL